MAQVTPDADTVRTWLASAVDTLRTHRAALDELNVFPVPDSDTGTNLHLTLTEALHAVRRVPPGAEPAVLSAAAVRGALTGARGNSGVILGQYLAVVLAGLTGAAATSPAATLASAARAARAAVGRPVEGTMLTVADVVARTAAGGPGTLASAVDAGWAALPATSEQIPALRSAGVPDAGAWGLLLVLDELVRALGGTVAPRPAPPTPQRPTTPAPHLDAGVDGEMEVMYLVTESRTASPAPGPGPDAAPDAVAEQLRTALGTVGGSVAVVGADGLWQAHVHTDHPLDAVDVPARLGLRSGPVGLRHLVRQSGVHAHAPTVGLVLVTARRTLAPDLARAGAVVVLTTGALPDAPDGASRRDVVDPGGLRDAVDRAVEDTGAGDVVVVSEVALPSLRSARADGRVRLHVVDGCTGIHLVVAASTLATGAVDGSVGRSVDAAGLRSAVEAVRTVAVRVGGPGDADRVLTAATGLLDDGPASAEVLTVLSPLAASAVVQDAATRLQGSRPDLEVVVLTDGHDGDVLVGCG